MTDSVTLQKALQDVGTADVGLLEHCIKRVAPGLPPFGDDGVDAAAWEKVQELLDSMYNGTLILLILPMPCLMVKKELLEDRA